MWCIIKRESNWWFLSRRWHLVLEVHLEEVAEGESFSVLIHRIVLNCNFHVESLSSCKAVWMLLLEELICFFRKVKLTHRLTALVERNALNLSTIDIENEVPFAFDALINLRVPDKSFQRQYRGLC